MYRVAISRDFIARHLLVGGDWGRENQDHAHHYRAEVQLEGDQLDQHGYLLDIEVLEKTLLEVIDIYRDRVLNDIDVFQGLNPSLEHFSRIIHRQLSERLNFSNHKLTVRLWENQTDWASYSES